MHSYYHAIEKIETHAKPKKAVLKPLKQALHHVLSQDIKAQYPSPPFHQSAMDGYAVCYAAGKIKVLHEEIAAGNKRLIQLKKNEAIRIFTGAPVPANTTFIVPQENVELKNEELIFSLNKFKAGDNIRPAGSQFQKGETLLKRGEKINALNIALLASSGIAKVKVIEKPLVSIIVTGDELISTEKKLQYGEIYESNAIMLESIIEEKGFHISASLKVKDSKNKLKKHILQALENSDVLMLSGGISVGKYDYTKEALLELGVKEIFYKVAQKPGKPIYFGKLANKYIFALPGNPAASLTCFYEYALPLLKMLSGAKKYLPVQVNAIVTGEYQKKQGLTHFLKAWYHKGLVEILPNQESYKISSYGQANCLAVIPENMEKVKPGQELSCHLLDDYMI